MQRKLTAEVGRHFTWEHCVWGTSTLYLCVCVCGIYGRTSNFCLLHKKDLCWGMSYT